MVVKAVGQFTGIVAWLLAHAHAGASDSRFLICPEGINSQSIRASTRSIEIAVKSQPERATIWKLEKKDDVPVSIEERQYQVGSSQLGAGGFQVFVLEAPAGTVATLELTKFSPIPPVRIFRKCSVTVTW
jgi:hypothetical protein